MNNPGTKVCKTCGNYIEYHTKYVFEKCGGVYYVDKDGQEHYCKKFVLDPTATVMKRKTKIVDPTTSTTDYDIAKKQFGAHLARAEISNDITEALARTLQQEGTEYFIKGKLTYTSKAGVARIMTSFSNKLAKIVKGLT